MMKKFTLDPLTDVVSRFSSVYVVFLVAFWRVESIEELSAPYVVSCTFSLYATGQNGAEGDPWEEQQ